MFGRKHKDAAKNEAQAEERREAEPETADADALMRQTLSTLDRSLALKREAREKTQRFVGSLRPFAKAR